MKEQTAISVIVPIYNSEKYLLRAMHAIMAQSFLNIEIICVEDASTDGSRMLLQKLQKEDERIKVICHEKNMGAAVSRNEGLLAASGEYVIFLDSDDYFHENMLEVTYENAVKHQADVVLFGSEQVQMPDSLIRRVGYGKQVIEGSEEKRNLLCQIRHVPWDKLVRRSFLNEYQIRFPDLPANEDIFYSYAVVLLAQKIVTCEGVFVRYYCGRDGSLTDFCLKKENFMVESYHEIFCFMQKNSLDEYVKMTVQNLILDNLQHYFSDHKNVLSIRQNTLDKLKKSGSMFKEFKQLADAKRLYPHNNVFMQRVCKNEDVCQIPYEQYLEDGILEVISPLLRQKKKIAVWGCGERGQQLLKILDRCGLRIDYLIDAAEDQQGKEYDSYVVVPYETVKDKVEVILITNMQFFEEIRQRAAGRQVFYVWQ